MNEITKIQEIISNQLGLSIKDVIPEASFTDDLGADSLDIVELIMAFEETFDIEIPDEDAEAIVTVGDAAEYILRGSHDFKAKVEEERILDLDSKYLQENIL